MFKNILVPVDGSEMSLKGVQEAADMAAKMDAKVTLFHVVAPLPASVRSMINERELLSELMKEGQKILEEAKNIFSAQNQEVEMEMVLGDYAQEILEKAKRNKHDLIIMGSKGKGAIEGFIMGSVTKRVTRYAPCSVLIVR